MQPTLLSIAFFFVFMHKEYIAGYKPKKFLVSMEFVVYWLALIIGALLLGVVSYFLYRWNGLFGVIDVADEGPAVGLGGFCGRASGGGNQVHPLW